MFEIVQCVQMYNKTTSNFKKIHVNAHVCTGVGLRGRGPLKGPAVNQFNDCHMGFKEWRLWIYG